MSENNDIRWVQRLSNFKKAFRQLELAVELATEQDLSDLEKEGLIQRFEYTQELAWQTLKDFFEFLGESGIHGSRDAFQLAAKRGLVNNGEVLMASIKSRNKTVHTYNEETANEIFHEVVDQYYQAFSELKTTLEQEQETRKL